jgi:hypothetical protein
MFSVAALTHMAESARTVPVRVVEVSNDPGFDWGDAALGALAAVAVAVIAYGAVLARRAFPTGGEQ